MSDLGPADVPAVLQVGEEVLPREEASLYRRMFPNGMLEALQGGGRAAMQGLDSLSGNYLRDYDDVLSGRERGWRALATLGTPMVGAGVGNAAQWIPRGGEAMLDYLAESRLVGAMPGRMQIPTARVMAAGRDAALGAAEVGEGALNGAEAYTWGQRAAPMRYDDRSGAVVDQQGRSWYHDGGTVLEPGGALRPVDYTPDFDEESLYWHHRGELAGGGVQQPGGERSTLYQAALPGPGGRSYNVPTVWDGQIVTTDEARDRAAGQGWRFPSYATPDAADLAYEARVHPRAAADTARYEELHEPFPTAAERRGRELMAPGRDAIGSLLPSADPNLPAAYDRNRSFRENALDPQAINNSMGIALGFAGGGLGTRNAMPGQLGRIEQLSGESLEERLGGRVPGYPRRSFSEIQRTDKGELEQLEPRSLYDRLPDPKTVWHGSPAKFSIPDYGKIGTGEGNQSYSHGLYWAEAQGTGQTYSQDLVRRNVDRTAKRIEEVIDVFRGGFYQPHEIAEALRLDLQLEPLAKNERAMQAIAKLATFPKRGPYEASTGAEAADYGALDTAIAGMHGKGHLYKGELYMQPERVIDWEKHEGEQSEIVRKALTGRGLGLEPQSFSSGYHGLVDPVSGSTVGVLRSSPMSLDEPLFPGYQGISFVKQLEQSVGRERASEMLHKAGVQGLRYQDQNSRFADPKLIKIGETRHEPSNLVGEHWAEAYPDADVGGNYEEYSGFAKAHYDLVDHGQLTLVKNLNPKNPFDAGYLKARRLLKAKDATREAPDPTYNYVTYSDQPVLLHERDGERLTPGNFSLTPVDHEPEF